MGSKRDEQKLRDGYLDRKVHRETDILIGIKTNKWGIGRQKNRQSDGELDRYVDRERDSMIGAYVMAK